AKGGRRRRHNGGIVAMGYEHYDNIIEPFLENVRLHPDRLACVCDDVTHTYQEMNVLTDRIARAFVDRGVTAGDRVAYLIPNSIELVGVYLAIQRIGAVAVPLNYRLISREIAFLTNAVDAKLLVFDKRFVDKVEAVLSDFESDLALMGVGTSTSFAPRLWDLASEAPIDPEVPLFKDPSALSRIQFTGGSTGLPKGACRTHRQDLTEIHACIASNGMLEMDHPIALIQCPLEHHGGHSWFMSALSSGATTVICGKFDPQNILSQIEQYGVTHMILLPPTTYLRLMRDEHVKDYDLSSVRIVQSAAGAMTPEVISEAFEVFPNTEVNYGWGQSESGTGTSIRITRDMVDRRVPELASVGTPMETLEVRIVDDEGLDVEEGQPGEAIVRSPAVMSGYYGQEELTRNAFTSDGWLRTGDIMRRDENGYLYLMTRKKDMIKSGGENVFINEVQTAILRNPLVADCVVFGTSDPVMGEAVAAVVQPVPGASLTAEDVQETCKQYIASYKKPRYVQFIDDLHRDDAGKVRLKDVIDYFDRKRAERK
ncbi:MAG TPA: acyl--CoA ligase, partial [Slackia equolifaciens]|nr:acyl--CoA ligase [Slackia equolifaciens]